MLPHRRAAGWWRPPLRRRLHERRAGRRRRRQDPRGAVGDAREQSDQRDRSERDATDGLVVVDKPAGWTSHDVVGKLRKMLRAAAGRPRGHARSRRDRRPARRARPGRRGCCASSRRRRRRTGRAIVFGVATDTLDAPGAVLERAEMSLTREQVEQATRAFVGESKQIPPMVSALKVDGATPVRARREGRGGRTGAARRSASTGSRSRRSSRARIPRPRSCSTARAARTFARSRPISAPRSAAAPTSASCAGCASVRSASTRRTRSTTIAADPDARRAHAREAMRDLEPVVVAGDEVRARRARRDVRGARAGAGRRRRRAVRGRSTTPASCSRCTSGAAPA